ncbi:hypothetical protein ACFQ3W_23245 [Paenibacillus puldeungensis]|uniref:Uncharacterized protein n=1 Tax=Paenibacillus puldeungensis TaxID=696536 RepID=A0ABW3S328_9BACL
MLVQWLEPVIETKSDEINDEIINNEESQLYEQLVTIVKQNGMLNSDDAIDIENVFLLAIRKAVYIAYKKGLTDGINIYRKI